MTTSGTETYQSANHHKYTSGNGIYKRHLEAFLDLVADSVKTTDPKSVLDAGCGEGFSLSHIARLHPELRLTGVDLSEGAIAYAEKHFGDAAQFRKGSIYKLPFSDNSFDTVLCSEVLEHLDDPDKAVAQLKRVARNYVVITVPREPYFQWLNNVGQWLKLSPDPGHVNFWTKDSFQTFIRSHFEAPTFAWKHIYQLAVAQV